MKKQKSFRHHLQPPRDQSAAGTLTAHWAACTEGITQLKNFDKVELK